MVPGSEVEQDFVVASCEVTDGNELLLTAAAADDDTFVLETAVVDGANVITVSLADAVAWAGSVDELTTEADNAFTATGQIAPAEDDTAFEDYSLTGVCNG